MGDTYFSLSKYAVIPVSTSITESDYLRNTGFVEFNPGEYFREINVSIVDDEVLEDLEMFSATLTSNEPNVVVEEFSDRTNVSIVDEDREYFDFVSPLYRNFLQLYDKCIGLWVCTDMFCF